MISILRQVYIYKNTELVYYRQFGKALKQEILSKLIKEVINEALSKVGLKGVESYEYFKYKISYTVDFDTKLGFLFVTGLTDNVDSIKKELTKCKKDFLNLFGDIINTQYDAKTFEVFDPTIDGIHRSLRPKISLVGFSGVGKTTITKLIQAEEIPMTHVPTITGDIATIKIGKLYFHLWDFAGQEQFSYLWNNFIKGSDAVLLITDSSLENIEKSKFFLELIKDEAPNAHTAVIGNKQDLPESLKPEQIEKILGLKTYSMIAKEANNRNKMIQIIADILEMSAEISPLLKPLLERDKLIEEAMAALESAEFPKALIMFEKISDLCLELGDDSLSREFYEKAQKIKQLLKGAEAKTEKLTVAQKIEAGESSEAIKTLKPPASSPPKIEAAESSEAIRTPQPPPQGPPKIDAAESSEAIRTPQPPPQGPPKIDAAESPEAIRTPQPPPQGPPKIEAAEPSEAKTIDKIEGLEHVEKLDSLKEKVKKKKKEKKKEKKKKKDKKENDLEEKVEISSIIKTPSFLKNIETKKSSEASSTVKTPIKVGEIEESWKPETLRPFKKEPPKTLTDFDDLEEKEEVIIKPSIKTSVNGLKINLEDFMIKQRPKQVVDVPKDAKNKLKTSSFAHVMNPTKITEEESQSIPQPESIPLKLKAPEPVNPTRLIKPKVPEPVAPSKLIKPQTINESSGSESQEVPIINNSQLTEPKEQDDIKKIESKEKLDQLPSNKKDLENSLMELKIKKAQLQKMALDFEMQELSGEISIEELNEKKLKLTIIEKKLENQIREIQNILDKL